MQSAQPQYPTKVFLNGRIVDLQEAKISVFDRGFLFGDGVYEVMVGQNGQFYFIEDHFKRLQNSLAKVKIDFQVDSLFPHLNALLQSCSIRDEACLLYIQITRGIAPRKHNFPQDASPSVMMYILKKALPGINKSPLSVITSPDKRWLQCDIKMISLLGNVLANQIAVEHKVYETLLYRENKITEGSHCNVFFVKNDVVYTHPADEYILNGITRQKTIDLCKQLGIEVNEKAITVDELYEMDEAFLTGTTTQIASIKKVNDHFYYEGSTPGAVTAQLQKAFKKLKLSKFMASSN